MKNLIFFILAIAIFSCSTTETDNDICINNMIQTLDMENYNGVIKGECRDYLTWYTHEGNDYFMLDNPCADYALHLWDCEKVDICFENSAECQTIMGNMIHQGVVGKGIE